MLTLIEEQGFESILVINWDRLTRNEIDGARLTKAVQDSETLVIQLDPFDVTNNHFLFGVTFSTLVRDSRHTLKTVILIGYKHSRKRTATMRLYIERGIVK